MPDIKFNGYPVLALLPVVMNPTENSEISYYLAVFDRGDQYVDARITDLNDKEWMDGFYTKDIRPALANAYRRAHDYYGEEFGHA